VTTALTVAGVTLLGLGVAIVLLFLMRRRLFTRLVGDLPEVYAPLPDAADALRAGETDAAATHATEAAGRFVHWYSWLAARNWALRVLVGVAATFGALIGSALLFEQNKKIEYQNTLIHEQNQFLKTQVNLQREQWAEAHRAQLQQVLFDCRAEGARCVPTRGIRARTKAALALVRMARAAKRVPDLTGAPLAGARLSGADLSAVDLRDADLAGARLDGADLRGARLARARLRTVALAGAKVDGARWLDQTDARGLDADAWIVCARDGIFSIAPDPPGCDARLLNLEALDVATLSGTPSNVGTFATGGRRFTVACWTPMDTLSCRARHAGGPAEMELNWRAGGLRLQVDGRHTVEVPQALYTRLRLDRFNPIR
jgi:Na+-transporting methylmalonyl-CoA/oxaloacetate decarboxylase gamma subunit